MRFLHFILSHSIFISLCAAALCFQTNVLLHLPHDINVYGFIFFSTLCGYNFYWLLSKFYFSQRTLNVSFFERHISFVLIFLIAAAGTAFFVWPLQHIWKYVAGGMVLTLLYSLPLWPFRFSSHLQKAGFFKTTLLSFTWAYVTTIIPVASVGALELYPVFVLLAGRFCFMLLLCIIFDMRDISVDKMNGLHSLATDMSRRRLSLMIGIVFILYIIAGSFIRQYFHDTAQEISFVVTGAVIWFVYRLSLKKRGYVFYYFLVDGLMLVSAAGTYFAEMVK